MQCDPASLGSPEPHPDDSLSGQKEFVGMDAVVAPNAATIADGDAKGSTSGDRSLDATADIDPRHEVDVRSMDPNDSVSVDMDPLSAIPNPASQAEALKIENVGFRDRPLTLEAGITIDPDLTNSIAEGESGGTTTWSASAPTHSAGSPAPDSPLPDPPSRPRTVTLKNARVGIEYAEQLDLQGLTEVRIEQPTVDPGLHIEPGTCQLRGNPTTPGDFEWRVRGFQGTGIFDAVYRLAIIPDPRSLWKDIASDPQAPFWKRDQDSATLLGEVYCVGASKRGRSHAHEGGFRDDHFALTTTGPSGWHVMVVGDGAGSARFSRQGSKVAVEYVARNLPARMAAVIQPKLTHLLDLHCSDSSTPGHAIRTTLYEVLVGVAFEASRAVESEAKHAGLDPADLSTTLIMSATTKVEGNWFTATFSVGDGAAVLLDLESSEVIVMSTPDGGDFAGQTRFLRNSEFSDPNKSMSRIHYSIRPSFTALALMTDGITDPKFPTEVALADFMRWREFWMEDLTPAVDLSRGNEAGVGEELLRWMDFWSDGNHDDRTLAILLP